MEMLFGNGEQVVFTQESSQYQTELKPGEELSICFAGEVNENAFGKWEDNDISVSVVYSWEAVEELQDPAEEESIQNEEEEIKEKTQLDEKKGKSEKQIQNDGNIEKSQS